ncbi:MAG: YggS family pyridoxal phosphate-dependent enzyme [Cytophagales bacterium]|nr:YggS family pyridoxal phosphate-dependent enzyme [Cytophagales bacterium]
MGIKNNITNLNNVLASSGARLVAVSKNHPVERLREAYACGQKIFGENRVQELIDKKPQLPDDVAWHLIGHLQRNKVKQIAPFVSLIHSVDSMRLLEEIDKQGQKCDRVIPCLLQVHIAREETKFGLDVEETMQLVRSPEIAKMKNIRIEGLMGMATLTDDHEQVRNEFRGLRKLFDDIKQESLAETVRMKELSMGMSSDYIIALEEGSTLVRVGTTVFGERNPNQKNEE